MRDRRRRQTAAAGASRSAIARARDRRVDRPHQARPRALLRVVAEFMLPHLKGRALLAGARARGRRRRAVLPEARREAAMPGMTRARPGLWPGHARCWRSARAQALVAAAQMNVIEFHTWNSIAQKIDKPDRMIFDLDPGEGVDLAARAGGRDADARAAVRAGPASAGSRPAAARACTWWCRWRRGSTTTRSRRFSQRVVQHLARDDPAALRRQERAGRTASARSSSTTCATASARPPRPRSRRARGRAWACRCRSRGTSCAKIKSGAHWTIATARDRLSFQTVDPWAGYWKKRQPLAAAMKRLGYAPPGQKKDPDRMKIGRGREHRPRPMCRSWPWLASGGVEMGSGERDRMCPRHAGGHL